MISKVNVEELFVDVVLANASHVVLGLVCRMIPGITLILLVQ